MMSTCWVLGCHNVATGELWTWVGGVMPTCEEHAGKTLKDANE